MVSKVDMNTHQMRVFRNGKLIRTIPITTGEQPKFTTRSGTKVIVEKFRHKRMNSETIGIDPDSADGYDLDDVEYAMRVTYSGEFIHAAPWSVGSQGNANVSHGCTGMSTANAGWLYNNTKVGDVVEYTGTSKRMTLTNGFGDWNETLRPVPPAAPPSADRPAQRPSSRACSCRTVFEVGTSRRPGRCRRAGRRWPRVVTVNQ